MKKLATLCAILFATGTLTFAQNMKFEAVDEQGGNALEWNYGTIDNASNGVREFKFTNTGKAPLLITNAKGSCGCTVPTYPKDNIAPGESSIIKVKYDTKRVGNFTKYVTLTTNDVDNPVIRLKIFGNVKAPVTPANTIPTAKPAVPANTPKQ